MPSSRARHWKDKDDLGTDPALKECRGWAGDGYKNSQVRVRSICWKFTACKALPGFWYFCSLWSIWAARDCFEAKYKHKSHCWEQLVVWGDWKLGSCLDCLFSDHVTLDRSCPSWGPSSPFLWKWANEMRWWCRACQLLCHHFSQESTWGLPWWSSG